MAAASSRGAILPPGWGSSRSRNRPETAPSWVRYPSAATNMCGHYSCKPHTSFSASPQHVGNRARQQACAHRLGGPRTRSLLSAEDHHQCLTPARSGPPRGCPPPLSATIAHHVGRASDGGSEGMASPDLSDIKIGLKTD